MATTLRTQLLTELRLVEQRIKEVRLGFLREKLSDEDYCNKYYEFELVSFEDGVACFAILDPNRSYITSIWSVVVVSEEIQEFLAQVDRELEWLDHMRQRVFKWKATAGPVILWEDTERKELYYRATAILAHRVRQQMRPISVWGIRTVVKDEQCHVEGPNGTTLHILPDAENESEERDISLLLLDFQSHIPQEIFR